MPGASDAEAPGDGDAQAASPSAAGYDEQMRALVEVYTRRLAGYAARMTQLVSDLAAMPESDRAAALEEMLYIAHKLAGSAPTFGFPEIAEVAVRCEEVLHRAVADDNASTDLVATGAGKLIAAISVAIE